MRLLLVCSCRNDANVVEFSIRHNLQFCDAVAVVDRNSVDGSRELLVELRREGLPIIVFDDPRLGVEEQLRVSRFGRNIRRIFRPDRIFLLNADEIIVAEDRSNLENELAKLTSLDYPLLPHRVTLRDIVSESGNRITLESIQQDCKTETWVGDRVLTGEQLDDWESSRSVGTNRSRSPVEIHLQGFSLISFAERCRRKIFLDAILSWLDKELIVSGEAEVDDFLRDLFAQMDGDGDTRDSIDAGSDRETECSRLDTEQSAPMKSRLFSEALGGSRNEVLSDLRQTLGRAVAPGRDSGQERVALTAASAYEGSVAESGSLGAEFHIENLYLDLPPFRYVWDTFRPRTVLDLGCGLGGYLEMFRRWGAEEILGVDDFDEPDEFLAEGSYLRQDLRERCRLGKRYDVVLCTEVLEHVEKDHESAVLENIANHAEGLIVFSAARPEQPGVGHINCQPPEYWIEKWKTLGWVPEAFDSLAVRALSTFFWFRRNLIILVRDRQTRHCRHDFTVADLDSFEARHAPWHGEAPFLYDFPLSVELPRLNTCSEDSGRD